MSDPRLHFVYDRLLRKCLALAADDARAIRRHWQLSDAQINTLLIRTCPSEVGELFASDLLVKTFGNKLNGVPGFYAAKDFSGVGYRWKLNLPVVGLVRPYYEARRICGLIVYRSVKDESPRLLSSRHLLLGTKARPYNPLSDHEIIHEHHITTPRPSRRPGLAGFGTHSPFGREEGGGREARA